MQALPIYLTIPLFLVIIGVLVLVHEFGHFVTAKIFGVEAPEFGLGFPPRLVKLWHSGGWVQIQGKKIRIPRNFVVPQNVAVGSSVSYRTKRENDREVLTGLEVVDEESRGTVLSSQVQALDRGTDFTLNAIPFGGFVRMKGEDVQNRRFSGSRLEAVRRPRFLGPASRSPEHMLISPVPKAHSDYWFTPPASGRLDSPRISSPLGMTDAAIGERRRTRIPRLAIRGASSIGT